MRLPAPSLFGLGACIGVTLRERGGDQKTVFHEVPSGRFDMDHNPPSLTFGHGEQRRYLVDLAELIPTDIPAGDYALEVTYVAPKFSIRSGLVEIALQAADASDREWLVHQTATYEQAGSWGLWVLEPPVQPPTAETIKAAPELARFYAALRYFAHAPSPVGELEIRVLSGVTGVPRPEAMLLGVELALARDNISAAKKLQTRLEQETPDLLWRVALANQGAGVLAGLRFD